MSKKYQVNIDKGIVVGGKLYRNEALVLDSEEVPDPENPGKVKRVSYAKELADLEKKGHVVSVSPKEAEKIEAAAEDTEDAGTEETSEEKPKRGRGRRAKKG